LTQIEKRDLGEKILRYSALPIRFLKNRYLKFLEAPPVAGLNHMELVEKLTFFRLIKNAQMQGARNPEE